jgi:hypothetical protein
MGNLTYYVQLKPKWTKFQYLCASGLMNGDFLASAAAKPKLKETFQ